MGSTSDWGVMSAACETLEELGIEYEKRVISAHRTPHLMVEYAESAKERGIGAIIAGAGGAAHVAAGDRCAGPARVPRRHGLVALDRADAGRYPHIYNRYQRSKERCTYRRFNLRPYRPRT